MKLVRGLHNIHSPCHDGSVVTIGNFDGVHLGHQAILGQLSEKAAELKLPSVVITFEPHPVEFFNRTTPPPRLTRFREKYQTIRRFSVDSLLCLQFNEKLASMPAETFINTVLLNGLKTRYLIVGDDFRFGHQRRGDFAMLQAAGKKHDFQVVNMHTFAIDGARVSSTRIRAALTNNDLSAAEKLLGRPYRISGRVAHGDKRGRQIGFPTANIHLHRRSTPLHGVYAVELFGLNEEPLQGVANIGTRPTVNGTRCQLEVHLFDFAEDIYGQYVQIDIQHKLRDEQRFASIDALTQQIQQDVVAAQLFFAG
ncbi:MAG: bifunctional riboflavin kinase/FAD synthetase [Gammaproteobacteria bacterium]|nr:bifunctional riboflavin kinase/FAD synthetase [Gammaproteobacteria bacterium]